MHAWFDTVLLVATINTVLAYALTFARHAGRTGREVVDACARAPLLDLVVGVFTWIPWVVGFAVAHWAGLFGSVVGEVIAFYLWVGGHELIHREAAKGPRIVKALNGVVGPWRNHLALWVSVIALPGFLGIRLMEAAVYPLLVLLLRFPKYKTGEWINCSRQHFSGLIGHDLIWCLYCDWMTGIYSLGGEMLRNVESFWCPIRYYDGKKCENCVREFPDIDKGWVPADGTMAQVSDKLVQMYDNDADRAWFGHPVRLTVRGKSI